MLSKVNFKPNSIHFQQRRFFSSSSPKLNELKPADPKPGVNWGAMSFSLTKTDKMYLSKTKQGTPFKLGTLENYGPLQLEPAATVLNYGQGIFEGIKGNLSNISLLQKLTLCLRYVQHFVHLKVELQFLDLLKTVLDCKMEDDLS